MDKVKSLHEHQQLGLIAIDEARLVYEWDGFRKHYQQCETIPKLFDGISVMALIATATPAIFNKLIIFLNNPVITLFCEYTQYTLSCTSVQLQENDGLINPLVLIIVISMNLLIKWQAW